MDNRIKVESTKQVDLAVLDQELGGHGLCGIGTDIVAVEGSPVTEAQLAAAIEAHVYVDVQAQRAADRLAATEHAKSLGFTDAMIAVMYPNLGAQ